MMWMIRLYLLMLRLYPHSFRARFAEEMESVFRAGLADARLRGTEPGFVLREALGLPGSLADAYLWSLRSEQSGRVALSGAGGTVSDQPPTQREGWGFALLAGLPHLLLGLVMASTALLAGVPWLNQAVFGNILLVGFALVLIGGLVYNLRSGWRRWSASWLIYILIAVFALLSQVTDFLIPLLARGETVYTVQNVLQFFVLPLALAYLLYRVAWADRLRGFLAAIPLTAVVWVFFEEFVPALPRSLAWGWLCLILFGATVMILRSKRFALASGIGLAVPVLVGLPFAYLGVYQGGTLPFSEPGPSLREVFRQYLPFLLLALTIPLGPQLAVQLRATGRESAAAGGKIFYRLALGGLLLGLVAALLHLQIITGPYIRLVNILLKMRLAAVALGGVLYVIGFGLLVWAVLRSDPPATDNRLGLHLASLFVLLPGVPALLLGFLSGVITTRQVPSWMLLVGVAWVLAAAVWVASANPATET